MIFYYITVANCYGQFRLPTAFIANSYYIIMYMHHNDILNCFMCGTIYVCFDIKYIAHTIYMYYLQDVSIVAVRLRGGGHRSRQRRGGAMVCSMLGAAKLITIYLVRYAAPTPDYRLAVRCILSGFVCSLARFSKSRRSSSIFGFGYGFRLGSQSSPAMFD